MNIKIEFHEFGPTSGVHVLPDEQRPPTATEVVVEHRSIAVNAADWKVIAGMFQQMIPLEPPVVPGSAAAGTVVAVGTDVERFAVGDRVVRAGFIGSFRTRGTYPEDELRLIPAGVDEQTASALPGSATTGYSLVQQADVSAEDVVLVHGSAGGVGSAAAMIAVARGARVLGTASTQNHEYLTSIGVEPIPYGDGLLERVRAIATPTVSLDAAGSPEAVEVSITLRAAGARVVTAVPGPAAIAADLPIVQHAPDELDRALELAVAGALRYPVVHSFALEDAATALQLSSSGHFAGKILLTP